MANESVRTNRNAAPAHTGARPRLQTSSSPLGAAGTLLELQRKVGNIAVSRMLSADRSGPGRRLVPQALQRMSVAELQERGKAIEQASLTAPEEGANLWLFTGPNTRLYVLGTMHTRLLHKLVRARAIIAFLKDTQFEGVYSELAEKPLAVDPAKLLDHLDKLAYVGEDKRRKAAREMAEYTLRDYPLDEVFSTIASRGAGSKGLEDEKTREAVNQAYANTPSAGEHRLDDYGPIEDMFVKGDQKALMQAQAPFLKQGIDMQHIEARNKNWVANVLPTTYHPGQTVLWIVGVSHLAGLTLELTQVGWAGQHVAL